jgi:hypothetical protein
MESKGAMTTASWVRLASPCSRTLRLSMVSWGVRVGTDTSMTPLESGAAASGQTAKMVVRLPVTPNWRTVMAAAAAADVAEARSIIMMMAGSGSRSAVGAARGVSIITVSIIISTMMMMMVLYGYMSLGST